MVRRNQNKHLAQRLALWAAGNMLPEAYVLRPYMDAFRKGIVAAVISGFMVSLGAAIGLFAFYTFLVSAGLEASAAMALSAGLAILVALVAYLACSRWMHAASHVKYSLKLFPHSPVSAGDTVMESGRAVMQGFMDGLKSPAPSSDRTAAKESAVLHHVQDELDRLQREIEALEAAAEAEEEAKARYQQTVHELYPEGSPRGKSY